jgi:hypothetical protein
MREKEGRCDASSEEKKKRERQALLFSTDNKEWRREFRSTCSPHE